MTQLKFIVERPSDGFIAYPLGLRGVAIGEGATAKAALADAKSAAKLHLETFGAEASPSDSSLLDAYVVEAGIDA